mgnify:CR=1 FL=1
MQLSVNKLCGFVLLTLIPWTYVLGDTVVVGKISFAKGSVAAQLSGQAPRILAKGAEIFQGDNIQTADQSFVIVEFNDGAKVTVRPDSSFSIDNYQADKAQLSLHEGGVRASSGNIAKQSPDNFQIKTDLATVSAQQAEYSVRVCQQDCEQEQASTEAATVKADQAVAGRVVEVKGQVFAVNRGEKAAVPRTLSVGAPLYSRDFIASKQDSYVLMVFKDGEKITLQANSEMDITQYHFQQEGKQDSAIYRLATGGMRALTGSIGKVNKSAYAVHTPVGTIGVRGTGFDLSCVGDCVNEVATRSRSESASQTLAEGLYAHVWQGQIALTNEAGEHLLTMPQSNYIANINANALNLANLPEVLMNLERLAPRPDATTINAEKLFEAKNLKGAPSGLYVTVHKGHVRVNNTQAKAGEVSAIDLGKDEAGHLDKEQGLIRLKQQPAFQVNDPYPLPEQFDIKKHNGNFSLNDKPGQGDACAVPN